MAESDASVVVVSPPPLPGGGGASVSALIDAAADTNDVDVCEGEGAAPHKEKPFVVVARAMQVRCTRLACVLPEPRCAWLRVQECVKLVSPVPAMDLLLGVRRALAAARCP